MKKKVPLIALIISCLFASAATYIITISNEKRPQELHINTNPTCSASMDQIRLNYYKFTKPLILANVNEESSSLTNIRSKVEQYISLAKSNGVVEDVSVYFRRMNDGAWFNINPEGKFNPASMSKLFFLITFLKEAEGNPSVMNKKLYFEKHYSEAYPQNIKDFELKPKNSYSVRDLLTYMIKYSDNDATVLLTQNMNVNIYKKLFSDFNVPLPADVGEYFITSYDYSKFLRSLYNATYINAELSEFGLSLLTQGSFQDGIKKGLNPDIEVAHKFGERILGLNAQLHEFGIVYFQGEPYMLGVMTKGKSLTDLSKIVADISRIAYSEYRMLPQI